MSSQSHIKTDEILTRELNRHGIQPSNLHGRLSPAYPPYIGNKESRDEDFCVLGIPGSDTYKRLDYLEHSTFIPHDADGILPYEGQINTFCGGKVVLKNVGPYLFTVGNNVTLMLEADGTRVKHEHKEVSPLNFPCFPTIIPQHKERKIIRDVVCNVIVNITAFYDDEFKRDLMEAKHNRNPHSQTINIDNFEFIESPFYNSYAPLIIKALAEICTHYWSVSLLLEAIYKLKNIVEFPDDIIPEIQELLRLVLEDEAIGNDRRFIVSQNIQSNTYTFYHSLNRFMCATRILFSITHHPVYGQISSSLNTEQIISVGDLLQCEISSNNCNPKVNNAQVYQTGAHGYLKSRGKPTERIFSSCLINNKEIYTKGNFLKMQQEIDDEIVRPTINRNDDPQDLATETGDADGFYENFVITTLPNSGCDVLDLNLNSSLCTRARVNEQATGPAIIRSCYKAEMDNIAAFISKSLVWISNVYESCFDSYEADTSIAAIENGVLENFTDFTNLFILVEQAKALAFILGKDLRQYSFQNNSENQPDVTRPLGRVEYPDNLANDLAKHILLNKEDIGLDSHLDQNYFMFSNWNRAPDKAGPITIQRETTPQERISYIIQIIENIFNGTELFYQKFKVKTVGKVYSAMSSSFHTTTDHIYIAPGDNFIARVV